MEIKREDYDNYKDYKSEYNKQYRIKNRDKLLEKEKEYRDKKKNDEEYKEKRKDIVKKHYDKMKEENPELLKHKQKNSYQKRKKYHAEYYKNRRNDEEWIEEKKIICKQYKKNNSEKIAIKAKAYKKTFNGKKNHKVSEWKTKSGLKEELWRVNLIFARWYYSPRCELCLKPYKNDKQRCMEHHHSSGHFRHICCVSCNNYLAKIDRLKLSVLIELHRYFNLNLIYYN